MKRVLLPVLVAALALPAGAAAAPVPGVTISVRQYVNVNKVYTLAFSGRIASGAAGESVVLLVRECGYDHFRVVEGATTTAGGFWSVETSRTLGAWRARWNDRWSPVVPIRMPVMVRAAKLPRRQAWRVTVPRGRQGMHGRIVELQRRTPQGRWVRMRQARFRTTPTTFQAVFEVPARGLTLRALVPARSAAPCYSANATAPWRS